MLLAVFAGFVGQKIGPWIRHTLVVMFCPKRPKRLEIVETESTASFWKCSSPVKRKPESQEGGTTVGPRARADSACTLVPGAVDSRAGVHRVRLPKWMYRVADQCQPTSSPRRVPEGNARLFQWQSLGRVLEGFGGFWWLWYRGTGLGCASPLFAYHCSKTHTTVHFEPSVMLLCSGNFFCNSGRPPFPNGKARMCRHRPKRNHIRN